MRRLAPIIFIAIVSCRPAPPKRPSDISRTVSSGLTVSPERAVAARLGLKPRFSIGLGNDAESYNANDMSAYKLGVKPDIHYMYLSNLDWPEWNRGQYITMHVEAARSRGIVPMFTLYQAATWGEKNLGAFVDPTFMTAYWRGVRIMFQRLGEANVPAIAHIEPDLWGYFQQRGSAADIPVQVRLVPECATLTQNVVGFGTCVVRLARKLAPKVVVGLHASTFGAYTNGRPDASKVGAYLRDAGGLDADIIVVETLDRDAGCFEAAALPQCQRKGDFYWDDADYRQHLEWVATIRNVTGKPILWWQMPLGVPSETPGSPGRYRDNRVRYTFDNAWRFAQVGGIGAVFGEGARDQTTVRTDGGQFKDALTKYLASGGNRLR